MKRILKTALGIAILGCGTEPLEHIGEAQVLWRANLAAYGPPAADADAVYFVLQNHGLAAVWKETGAVRWIASTGEPGDDARVEETPVRVGSVVVMGDEDLFAFNAVTGQRVWTFTGGGARVGLYRFTADASRLYTGSVTGDVFAVDPANGAELWRTRVRTATSSQVRIPDVRDGRVFVRVRYDGPPWSGQVSALDAATGAILWTFDPEPLPGLPTGVIDGIYAEPQTGPPLFVASLDDGRIVGLDAATGVPRWTIPRRSGLPTTQGDWRSLTATSGVLVASQLSPVHITGYSLATGEQQWQSPESEWGDFGSSPTAQGNLAFVTYSNGYLGAFHVERGQRAWVRYPPAGYFFDGPLASGDTLFLGAYEAAYAIRRK